MVVGGVWGLGDPKALPAGDFEGKLTGTLDPTTRTLAGDWNLFGGMQSPVTGSCIAPWSTTRSP